MTNEVKWIIGASLTSGASVSASLCLLHNKIRKAIADTQVLIDAYHGKRGSEYESLVAGLKTEFVNVHAKVEDVETDMHAKLEWVVQWLESHADLLRSSAVELRNHAKSVHDEAQASKQSVTRTVPTR